MGDGVHAAGDGFGAVDLATVVVRVADRFAHEPVRVVEVDEVVVRGDEIAIDRALASVIDNAIRHGRGAVTVALRDAGDVAWLTVEDEGSGPHPAVRDRVLEAGAGAGGLREGSGLGLAVVAATAARHGGRVLIDRARVTLELPIPD